MKKRAALLNWVKKQHKGQLIKRTKLPYSDHLVAVAEVADIVPLGYETGLCHDLLEETDVTASTLKEKLISFGYFENDAALITDVVIELTDVFTKKSYPDLSKEIRKQKEAERLNAISGLAQTVKYADLIYNIRWTLKYDAKDAQEYLQRKRALLTGLTKGDRHLRLQAIQMIDAALAG